MSTPTGDTRGAYAAAAELRPDVPLPDVTPVLRRPDDEPRVDDVPAATRAALAAAPGVGDRDLTGLRIAVTAGSRGIRDVATVVVAAVAWLREAGAEPFVVPAMGSHGGARAEGQVEVLADLGVTEAALGAPIEATMDTVVLGHLPDGTPIHHDAVAAAADGVLLVNRVKPHTDFRGYAESGLAKIAAIGLGNHRGASVLHAGGTAHLGEAVLAAIEVIRGHGHLLGGLGIVENSAEETAEVTFVGPDGLGAAEERALLDRAAAYLPVLPFDALDVLVVDRMGKDLSGSGMDTNVLGRCWVPGVEEFAPPHVTAITVHGLTPASHGNAVGFGLADVAPVSMLDGIDFRATYLNGITSGTGGLRRSRSPMLLADDDAVVRAAVSMCGRRDKAAVRLARIPDTLHPGTLLVSGALLDEVAADADLEVLGDPRPLTDGTHLTPW